MSTTEQSGRSFGASGHRVYQELRTAIVAGEYPPDSPLRLHELSDDFGVSLIPIREALRRLEGERLVTSFPNRGARVASISARDVEDAYNTRILLESEALRRAWPNLDRHALDSARQTLDLMFTAFEESRLADGADLHRQYHFDLWAMAESEWLDHLIYILWSHTERYRNLALALHTPSRSRQEHHVAMIDALSGQDLDLAIHRTEQELGAARDLVVAHVAAVLGADVKVS